jgi:hypothetical protein
MLHFFSIGFEFPYIQVNSVWWKDGFVFFLLDNNMRNTMGRPDLLFSGNTVVFGGVFRKVEGFYNCRSYL